MIGELNLTTLLRSMKPKLFEEDYVFCSVPTERVATLNLIPVCQFRESEGMTLIITKQQAEEVNLDYEFVCQMITLSVHSSLEAVGFLAAITNKLAENEISVNAVSAYYHDHLFVPANKAEKVMQILTDMSK
ncbi:ACT domain-containing protein [Synechocystis sp. PCC 7509]|uniref:ACT domain-containing protein n=1 Tax=Synechocystis sp. PCC 7509 TaxID=927677 RepID=UPI0002ACF2B2|nr:ACT domain-containing protein [Synechocystis sp. PCC 7509]